MIEKKIYIILASLVLTFSYAKANKSKPQQNNSIKNTFLKENTTFSFNYDVISKEMTISSLDGNKSKK